MLEEHVQDPQVGQEFARVNNTLNPDSMQVQACRQAASEFHLDNTVCTDATPHCGH